MKQYDFWAIVYEDRNGHTMKDRWHLKAGSFEEVCEIAQQLQNDECVEYGYDKEEYVRFELIGEVDV